MRSFLEFLVEVFEDMVSAFRQTIRRGRLDLIFLQFVALFVIGYLSVRLFKITPEQLQKVTDFLQHKGQESIAPAIAAVLAAAAFVVTLTLRYLKSDLDTEGPDLRDVRRRLDRLQFSTSGLSASARDNLVHELKEEAANGLADEFEKRLQQLYATTDAARRASRVREGAERMLERLRTEIRALVKRGNLNLGIGMAVTGVGAFILIYVALTAKSPMENWRSYLPSYVLRLSAVVFTEIFAFFFLGLYRANLTEIKYFQNEMTNLEAKCLALEFAILAGDQKSANRIADQLGQTERNFVLKKDQTTVELEKARLDSQHLHEFASVMKDFVPAAKVKKA